MATGDSGQLAPPRASFRKIREEYQRNGLIEVMYFTQSSHVPNDIFAYGREAGNCFEQRRYLATIILSSAIVEIVLNKDSRMRRSPGGWTTLTQRVLRQADLKGLPVSRLMEPNESLSDASLEFIRLRNRIAHGNLAGVIGFDHDGAPDYSPAARELAFNQLRKAEQFIIDWYNTSPDVQERKIQQHRWPDFH